MAPTPRVPIENVFSESDRSKVGPREVAAILEIAYLTVRADGNLADEELHALGSIAGLLGGGKPALSRHEVDALLDRFAGAASKDGAEVRLEHAAKSLSSREARELAFRTSVAMALCDLDASDREFEFELSLIDALGLSQDDADRLEADVHDALVPPDEGA